MAAQSCSTSGKYKLLRIGGTGTSLPGLSIDTYTQTTPERTGCVKIVLLLLDSYRKGCLVSCITIACSGILGGSECQDHAKTGPGVAFSPHEMARKFHLSPVMNPEDRIPLEPTVADAIQYSSSGNSISHFKNAHQSSRHSFFNLPLSVRCQIYRLAGAVRRCPIDLNREGKRRVGVAGITGSSISEQSLNRCRIDRVCDGWRVHCEGSPDSECLCPPVPVGLLHTCRLISHEVIGILYRENHFSVCEGNWRGLGPLLRLGSRSLSCLASVSVCLSAPNSPPENGPWACCDCYQCRQYDDYPESLLPEHLEQEYRSCKCHSHCKCGSLVPLGNASLHDRTVIATWRAVCSRLRETMSPGALRLHVVCDTIDYTTAREICKPLYQLSLARCTLRLKNGPHTRFRQLVSHTAAATTNGPVPNHSPINLPLEIQQYILTFTMLIAPSPLVWHSRVGFSAMNSRCCLECNPTLDFCTCHPLHSAYSPTCTCWLFPTSLFQISRYLRRAAFQLFASSNHFVSTHRLMPHPVGSCFFDLRHTIPYPVHTLPHLRTLTLYLPDFNDVRSWYRSS